MRQASLLREDAERITRNLQELRNSTPTLLYNAIQLLNETLELAESLGKELERQTERNSIVEKELKEVRERTAKEQALVVGLEQQLMSLRKEFSEIRNLFLSLSADSGQLADLNLPSAFLLRGLFPQIPETKVGDGSASSAASYVMETGSIIKGLGGNVRILLTDDLSLVSENPRAAPLLRQSKYVDLLSAHLKEYEDDTTITKQIIDEKLQFIENRISTRITGLHVEIFRPYSLLAKDLSKSSDSRVVKAAEIIAELTAELISDSKIQKTIVKGGENLPVETCKLPSAEIYGLKQEQLDKRLKGIEELIPQSPFRDRILQQLNEIISHGTYSELLAAWLFMDVTVAILNVSDIQTILKKSRGFLG